jgi:hypothetical protein
LTVQCCVKIYNIVTKLHFAGSLLGKEKSRKAPVLTEEKLDDIGTLLEVSPKMSLGLSALQCGQQYVHVDKK